jgi:hypothetical protein
METVIKHLLLKKIKVLFTVCYTESIIEFYFSVFRQTIILVLFKILSLPYSLLINHAYNNKLILYKFLCTSYCKACPSESGTEVGAQLFPAVKLCDFPGRWHSMSAEIWYTLDSGSVLLNKAEAR